MDLENRRVAVLGGGTSGFCAARLAQSRGAMVRAYDSGDSEKLAPAVARFADQGIELVTGEEALRPKGSYDLVVISPGIDASWPLARALEEVSTELIGEIELAWRLNDIPVIAITGTNGKTTTTELTTHLLNTTGRRAIAAGNYGYAYSDVVYFGQAWDWVVLEVSSFQLETIQSFRPKISVWMNFAPDHMDRYRTLEDYRRAKMRIFENQGEGDVAILKYEEGIDVGFEAITFSAFSGDADVTYDIGKIVDSSGITLCDFSTTRLNGKHNAENVMAAIACVKAAERFENQPSGDAEKSLAAAAIDFTPPAHRCEVVARMGGVTFVNDSKATNLHALESALRGQDEKVILIVGGKEKGLDYTELKDLVGEKATGAICIGEISQTIANQWQEVIPCHRASNLKEAVKLAWEQRGEASIVLFSPGTSSFDMFSGYEERGEYFKEAVRGLGV